MKNLKNKLYDKQRKETSAVASKQVSHSVFNKAFTQVYWIIMLDFENKCIYHLMNEISNEKS